MPTAGVGQPTGGSKERNPRRVASCMHAAENRRSPRKKGRAATPKEAQEEPTPSPAGREETQLRRHRKNPTPIYRDHQQGTTSRPRPVHLHSEPPPITQPPHIDLYQTWAMRHKFGSHPCREAYEKMKKGEAQTWRSTRQDPKVTPWPTEMEASS